MPTANRGITPVSLVVRWPSSVSAATADQVARRLTNAGLTSTWAIQEPDQAEMLRATGIKTEKISTALIIPASNDPAAAVDSGLNKFQREGHALQGIQVDASLSRGIVERRLRQAGVRAVVTGPTSASHSAIRPLPFGIWELGPHIVVPPRRRMLGLLPSSFRDILSPDDSSPTIASIDMARIGASNARSWRSVEQLIHQAAEDAATGAARVVSIAEVATELSQLAAPRPQRSILRAAA